METLGLWYNVYNVWKDLYCRYYYGSAVSFFSFNLCRLTLRLVNPSITFWWSSFSRISFSTDITARCWSLLWPMVLLSQVWSWLKTLKDLSQLQLLTGFVRATWITIFSVGKIWLSRRLYNVNISGMAPASFLSFRKSLATVTSSDWSSIW